ncbi:MAG: hypothetical protein QXL15_04330 [Candidatus Korarchaeota archaeon]
MDNVMMVAGLFAFAAILVCTLFLLRSYIVMRVRAMIFLLLLFFTLIGWALSDVLFAATGEKVFDVIDDIIGPASMFSGLLFSLEIYKRIRLIEAIGAVLCGIMIGIATIILIAPESEEVGYWIFTFPEFALFILLCVVTFTVSFKMFKKSKLMEFPLAIPLFFTSAAVMGYVGAIISIFVDIFWGIAYTYNIFAAAGSVLFTILLIKYPYSAYILPVHAERLLVFSKGGIPLYSQDIIRVKAKYDEAFTSSALSGIISLLTELLETKEIRVITMHGKDIQIAMGNATIGIIIVENYDKQVQSALEAFVSRFESAFKDKLDKNISSVNEYREGARKIFNTVFATLMPRAE